MNGKRITIYHLAAALGISASYVSRALNNHPTVSDKIKELVKKKAIELNYKHNTHAANLRQGSTKTIGVVVPHINQRFFSDVIAGIEEICFENNHSLIICQSHELYKQECLAVETLIHQNVDCIMISVSAETTSFAHLKAITEHHIALIQFDRCIDQLDSYKVVNDNKKVSFAVVKKLMEQGYKKIAFMGGPAHLSTFKNRKQGYLKAIKKVGLRIPDHFITDDAFSKEKAIATAMELLQNKERPDAFFTVSDHQSLGVLQAAHSLGIKVPRQLGIFGFANEAFSDIIHPTLSTVDQRSKEMGKQTAAMYFKNILHKKGAKATYKEAIIKSKIIVRESSKRI